MRTRLGAAALTMALLGVTAGGAGAVDHKNLDEGRPVRLEDAYTIAHREISIEAGAGLALLEQGSDRGFFPVEILYGPLPNLQLSLGGTLLTEPHAVDDRPRSGDLRLSALYNVNQETLALPALSARLSLTTPTGIDARGYGIALKGIVTKSVERLSLHLNGAWEWLTGTARAERDGRYMLALGASYPVGAPAFTRATLVADVFAEQPARRREATTVGTEVGLRYQLTPSIVGDVGIGTEFAGPAGRAPFFATIGLSVGF